MTTPGTALVRPEHLVAAVQKVEPQLAALAPEGVTSAHLLAALRLYIANNPKILDCTPASVAAGMLRVAESGLRVGVSCDLLPFGTACTFSPRYNGIIELALASGVRAIDADVVREGDQFEYAKGTSPYLKHVKALKRNQPITHAYAIAFFKGNAFKFEVLTREEIDAVRQKYSKSWAKGTLEEVGEWYPKKRAVRALAPYLPKTPRLAAALQYAEDEETAPATEPLPAEIVDEPQTPPPGMDAATGEILDLEPIPLPSEEPANPADATNFDDAPSCPKCGGAMWDNRRDKRNPKAPDFKCKDKACKGVIWPPRQGK